MGVTLGLGRERVVTLAPRGRRGARAGERMLADALDREARAPQGRIAVVVRLSGLPAPGPRPYHRRVARALLEDCAQRHGGQVIALGSGDLVLVTLPPRGGEPADAPMALPGLLARLLHGEAEAGGVLAYAVTLAEGAGQLRALAEEGGAAGEDEPAPRPRNPFAGRLSPGFAPLAPDALERLLAGGVAELLLRQTVALLPGRGGGGAGQIRPVFRVLAPSPAQLAARLAVAAEGGEPAPDPWLRQHIEEGVGRAMLALLRQAWGSLTPADASPRPGVAPMLLRLPLAALAGDGFAAFAALPHGPARPAVAIGIAEAAADPAGFAAARDVLRGAGMALALEGVTHHALVLARPEAFGPELVMLGWSGALMRLPEARLGEVAAAVARIGPERMVLTGADGEPALRWGRAMGMRLFQGAHVEAMVAAMRMPGCPHGAACGLRACTARAMAATALGRAGCLRPDLLEFAGTAAAPAGGAARLGA